MRAIPAILTAAAAGTFTITCAGPALAAPGVVIITAANGQDRTVADPKPRDCHRAGGPGSTLRNLTEGTVLVFPDAGCRTKLYNPVQPGGTKQGNIGSFFALD